LTYQNMPLALSTTRLSRRCGLIQQPSTSCCAIPANPPQKLIKHLSKTPILAAQQPQSNGITLQDSQASLQSNKAAFFFRLERELEKVNELYLQKEAEVRKAIIRFQAAWL